VGSRHRDVVVDNRNDVSDIIDELLTGLAVSLVGQSHTDEKLCDRDGGNGHLVVIVDCLVELKPGAVGVDEEGGVEQKPAQGRSSIWSRSWTEAMADANPRSGPWRRSMALTSAPLPVVTGSSWATTLPRRRIVKCSPRCSTASRMSEKFLAASVALTSGM